MDILYVIGNHLSEWYNNELRYSLRCLDKNGLNVDRVFVVGYKPPFLNDKTVTFIPCKDKTNVKHYNILACIEEAVKQTDIGKNHNGDFLYSSDDHFYVQPTDFDRYPHYWRGIQLPTERKTEYQRTLYSTRELLECCGLPTYHLAWHGNTYFNRDAFTERRFELIRQFAQTMPEGCEPTCLMLNYMIGTGRLKIEDFTERADVKLGAAATLDGIEFLKTEREVLSSTDNIEHSEFGKWLQRHYNKLSKYEAQ